MNKIHRIIWSETRQAFVAAPENSNAQGAPSSAARGAVLTGMTLVLLGLGSGQAMAVNSCTNPTGSNSIGNAAFGTVPCTLGSGGSATVTGGTVTYTGDGLLAAQAAAFIVDGGPATGITFDATGSVTATTSRAVQVRSTGSVTGNITNSGTLNVGGHGIELIGGATMTGNITNSGTLTTGSTFGDSSGFTVNGGSVLTGNIFNTGTVISDKYGAFITGSNALVTGYINNSGSITGGLAGIAITSTGSVTEGLVNSGTISSLASGVLVNGTTLSSLSNTGTITGTTQGVYVQTGTISTLTNRGTITNGINVGGTITTLNNDQNNLAYTGNLPSNYKVIINSASDYGKLVVTAPAGTTSFGIYSGSTAAPGTYTNVLSGVTNGNLVATTGSAGAYSWSLINSSGNLWDLTLAGSVRTSTLSQSNDPGLPAATVIDQNGDLLALFSNQSTAAQQSAAVSQTLPLLTGGSQIAAGNALSGINRVIQARVESNSGMSSGDDFMGDRHFWMKPFGSWADQNDMNGVSGYEAKTWGLALGADKALSDKFRLGLAFAYANSDIDSNSNVARQSADVDVYQLVGYGSYALNANTELNFQVDAGQNKNNGSRTIAFTNTVASSDYDSLTAHLGLGVARNFKLSNATTFTPSVRADYTWMKDDAYTETGAGLLNLDVNSRSSEDLVLTVEGKISHAINASTTLTANLGVGYDVIDDEASITAAFAGAPTATFVTTGLDSNPWVGRAGLGLAHTLKNGTEILGRYDAEFREDFVNQTASIKARWAF